MKVHPVVADVLARRVPVVALETTVFSTLGLPAPSNREALDRCLAAVVDGGAVPALTCVIDGEALVGVDEARHQVLTGPARKIAERDLPVAVATRVPYGATTVSASLTLAEAAGIEVFATGGIGGVHRGAELTGDVSADLDTLARRRVVCVCAGAKSFLDLARTLEYLDTASVPVLGWRTEELPAFYTAHSGLAVGHRVDSAEEVAAIARSRWALDGGGLLLAVPIPAAAALGADELDRALDGALAEADRSGIRGADVTPFLLEHLAAADRRAQRAGQPRPRRAERRGRLRGRDGAHGEPPVGPGSPALRVVRRRLS